MLRCGCECEVINDDLIINPSDNYNHKNNNIKTDFDHRIAMSFVVMGSRVGNLSIEDVDSIKTSFPNFIQIYNKSGGKFL